MLIVLGILIVFVSAMGGFVLAGGNPMVLLHISEFVIIGGVSIGIMMISTPKNILFRLAKDLLAAMTGKGVNKKEIEELMKLLYELFVAGRRNGLLALDEHISEPNSSSLFAKYPSIMKDPKRLEFLVNALRPIIDGKLKPDQLVSILENELHSMEEESHQVTGVMDLVGDSLPGVGIVAAVLGIINTMASIADGPDAVGQKVAAALTGTFLGIFAAYGFVNPLGKNLHFKYALNHSYYKVMVQSIVGFTRGFSPLMALEIARRALPEEFTIESDELELMMKSTTQEG